MGVLAVVCLGDPRDSKGQGPIDFRCARGDPITFTRSPNGRFSDWHNAPRRQYAIFLSGGQMEVVIGDGTTRRFGPGDAVLFEDLTGQGHTSRSVGGDRLTAIVPLAD